MADSVTVQEAVQYRARWRLVHAIEQAEWRQASYDARLRQTAALMISADAFGWGEILASEDRLAHDRWRVLRERYRG